MARHSSPAVDVFSYPLELRSMLEVRGRDRLAHYIPLAAAGRQLDLLLRHNVLELLPDFFSL